MWGLPARGHQLFAVLIRAPYACAVSSWVGGATCPIATETAIDLRFVGLS